MSKRAPRRLRPQEWGQLDSLGGLLQKTMPGDAGAVVPGPGRQRATELQALGDMLRRIARGEDAREVFGQISTGGRQNEVVFNFTRAVVYWRTRARGGTPAEALDAARDYFTDLPRPRVTTMNRIARQYRDAALERVEGRSHRMRPDGTWEVGQAAVDTATLRKHLAVKSKGGNRPK